VRRPDARPNMTKISLRVLRSFLVGLAKIAASLIYRETFIPLGLRMIMLRISLSVTLFRSFWRWSMAKMKSMGEIGSPLLEFPFMLNWFSRRSVEENS
jgi:hypothetical protein